MYGKRVTLLPLGDDGNTDSPCQRESLTPSQREEKDTLLLLGGGGGPGLPHGGAHYCPKRMLGSLVTASNGRILRHCLSFACVDGCTAIVFVVFG